MNIYVYSSIHEHFHKRITSQQNQQTTEKSKHIRLRSKFAYLSFLRHLKALLVAYINPQMFSLASKPSRSLQSSQNLLSSIHIICNHDG